MYDTTTLILEGVHYADLIPKYLNNPAQSWQGEVEKWSGTIGAGQRVYVDPYGVTFSGSIAKLLLGDNVRGLTRKDTQYAIEFLSDTLHEDFKQSKARRVDIACNILTEYEPTAYYCFLGSSGRYARSRYKDSLYYTVGNRQLIFYNKVQDAYAKGMEVPHWAIGQHILRYELRLKNRLLKQLNRSELKGKDLYGEEVYIQLCDMYLYEYRAINKLSGMQLDKEQIKTPGDLVDQMLGSLIMSSNTDAQERIDELMKQAKGLEVFDDPKYYSRANSKLKKLLQSTDYSSLVSELDEKVSGAIAFYR